MSAKRLQLGDLAAIRPAGAGTWSPDGTRIAYFMANQDGGVELWTVSPEGPATARLIDSGPIDPEGAEGTDRRDVLGGPQWSPDGRQIAYTAPGRRAGTRSVWLLPSEGGVPVEVPDDHRGSDRTPRWSPDGKRLAFIETMYGRDDICVAGLEEPIPLQLTYDRWDNQEPAWSPDGTRIVYISQRSDVDCYSNNLFLIALDSGSHPVRLTDDDHSNDRCPRWSPDGTRLVFVSNRGGHDDIWTIAADGSDVRQLTRTQQDAGDPQWSADGRWILYTQFRNGDVDLLAMPADGGTPVTVASGGENVSPRWSPDGRTILFNRSGPSEPGDLWIVGWTGREIAGEPRRLTRVAGDRIDDITFVAPRNVSFTSSDGSVICALLYPGVSDTDQPGPGIVYVRGGPNAVNYNGWVPQLQFFAQRGYTILVPDYRGSTGYGKSFMEANQHSNPGVDVDDWLAAADYLSALAEVDGERIAIMGRSYGGYATLLMLGLRPGRFQAGVAIAAPSNWFSYWEHTHLAWCRRLQKWTIGIPHEVPELTRARSPIVYAENITAPLLIIQGQEDVGNPVEQAEEMSTRLHDLGIPHEYRVYPGEGHVFVGADAIIDNNRQIETFLATHLADLGGDRLGDAEGAHQPSGVAGTPGVD